MTSLEDDFPAVCGSAAAHCLLRDAGGGYCRLFLLQLGGPEDRCGHNLDPFALLRFCLPLLITIYVSVSDPDGSGFFRQSGSGF